MKSRRMFTVMERRKKQMKRIIIFATACLVFSSVLLVHSIAEHLSAINLTAYFSSKSYDIMDIDSSLIISSPFEDCIAISIKVSFPNAFPNDDIAYFRAYLDGLSYEINYDSDIPMPWSAPSVFHGLIPFNNNLQDLRIVPVGLKEMEEWPDYEINFSDYKKQE